MERILKFTLTLLCGFYATAQVVGTPYIIPVDNRPILDQVGINPSFAFSTRKLRQLYTGPAVRIRRATDNAQADVAFDNTSIVSDNSTVTVAVAGGGLSVGNTLTLASFRSGSTLFVSTWYDQGANGYHGVQANTARQAVFSLNVIGPTNQYASLVFTGTAKHNVTVNQTLPVLLGSGLRGSVMMIGTVQNSTITNNSFGHSDISDNNIRWSTHMNWPDNNMYTDLGSSTDLNRSFFNDGTIGLGKNKQYTMIRATSSKIVRVSGIDRNNSTQNITSRTWSAGSTFGVGLTTGSLDTAFNQNGFTGNIPEFILFSEPLTAAQYGLIENNQILFWGAY
ncbi:arabinofuranosidase catalytic domain-containing protein [Flavobacterium succinicans]|uniref:Alpha-L-arabinofuranosidase B, catalytic n=1 Tax=Flavobacterium succinicans TaxID=29536 RepID=A0A199XTU9_9FLAO|nr:arabinofuranosidase catalytic domain-containing protein [Flavobacterium succinicans]OAZ05183.1 alpha-L-arabinofuranosidase B, catalytic [Flavobacterium succinicans]